MKKALLLSILFLAASLSGLLAQDKLYPGTFPLSKVKLLDGPLKHACELNIDVLLQYDTDRLLAPFLREAGLTPKKAPYGNWESDGLDGHIGGHYLTSLAIHYAATGNLECKDRMDYMVAEFIRCQNNSKHGAGYIGGVPVEKEINGVVKSLWQEIRNGNPGIVWNYWVPWYNVHKTYAGLRDAWLYGGNEDAKTAFLALCDWGIEVISHLNNNQMEEMLGNEFGGMNEVYADAYQMTNQTKYLNAAKRFAHKDIFDNMKNEVDNLDNKHANTQVPKAVGYQRVAELDHSNDNTIASRFFWETVVYNRSLSLGGNSVAEHFLRKEDCIKYTDDRQGPESCNTNNMLKLTEGLFRMDPKTEYADYYERAMFNHILSTQHPGHGGYVYFTPARPCHYRVYSAPEEAMWCCVGTGMENHGKYGQFIYTHAGDSLFVNLFVPSELTWSEKGITVKQETAFPAEEGSKLTIQLTSPKQFKLLVRHPGWVTEGMKVTVGDVNYAQNSTPSSYIVIDRTWNNGDVVEIETPMKVTIEEMPNVPQYISILRGPILLGAKTGTNDLYGLVAGDGRWEHVANGSLVSLLDAPYILGERNDILAKLQNMQLVAGETFKFTVPGLFTQTQYQDLVFEPFYDIHDSRYMMYWLSMNEDEFEDYLRENAQEEYEKLLLDRRTVDAVSAGEQQPESDHYMSSSNAYSGTHEGESWRDARDNGYFEYTLSTEGRENLSLMVRYWGNDGGNRTFDILIDNQLLVTENIAGKWNISKFVNVEYAIPADMLTGKTSITVRFACKPGNIAGGVFYVRILRPADEVSSTNTTGLVNTTVYGQKKKIVVKNLAQNEQANIYDLGGRMIKSLKITEGYNEIEIPSGMYIVELRGGKRLTNKVIVD